MGWALWEAGLNFWALTPRSDVLFALGIWLLLPFVIRRLHPGVPRRWRSDTLVLAAALIAISLTGDRAAIRGSLPPAASAAQPAPQMQAGPDWAAYGGVNYADRYSALNQINAGNVTQLMLAWQFETGDLKRAR
jgi:quinoprotein glucose dehydrogenase